VTARVGNGVASAKAKVHVDAPGAKALAARHAPRAMPRAGFRAMSAVAVGRVAEAVGRVEGKVKAKAKRERETPCTSKVKAKAKAKAKETTLQPPRWRSQGGHADATNAVENGGSSALSAKGQKRCTAMHAKKGWLSVTRAREKSGHPAASAREKSGSSAPTAREEAGCSAIAARAVAV